MAEGAVPTFGKEEIGRWVAEVLEPVLDPAGHGFALPLAEEIESKEAFQEDERLTRFNALGPLALLSADADRVKEYVFESVKLPEIRGGSMRLDELNWGKKWPKPPPAAPHTIAELFAFCGFTEEQAERCVLSRGGGSLLALLPPALAPYMAQRIEELYPQETGTATITCVWRELTPLELCYGDRPWDFWLPEWRMWKETDEADAGFLARKHFGELVERQALALRHRKDERALVPFMEAPPLACRCASCGIRPANRVEGRRPIQRLLCGICAGKVARSAVLKGKKSWTCEFEEVLRSPDSLFDVDRYLRGFQPGDLNWIEGAEDVGEIAQASRMRNAIGFIYADGNRVGHLVESSRHPEEYRTKSELLRKLIPRLVYAALGHHLRVQQVWREDEEREEQKPFFVHPFEIITIGGDDLLLIVPGDQALPIALEICRQFQICFFDGLRELAAQGGWAPPDEADPPAMSAGVVIAHEHNPIRFVHDLAKDLQKKAKATAWELRQAGRPQGTIDFLVLKSQSTLSNDVADWRGSLPYTSVRGREETHLTAKPYFLDELAELLMVARAMRDTGYPRTQVHALRCKLRAGRRQASLFYIYQQSRASQSQRAIQHWVDSHWNPHGPDDPHPWVKLEPKRGRHRYQTVWEDLHEVRELLPEGNEEPIDIQDESERRWKQALKELERWEQESGRGGARTGGEGGADES